MSVDDNYTKSLIHFDGADESTTFTDNAGLTWTAAGTAKIDNAVASPLTGGNEMGLFDGNSDYISTGDAAIWQLDGGSNDNQWTLDFWLRYTADPGTGSQGIIQQRVDNDNYWLLYLNNNSLDFIVRSSASNIVLIQNAWNPAADTNYHVAVVKQGATGYKMFVNGTQIGTTQTDTSTIPDFAGGVTIGRIVTAAGASVYHTGYIEEFRYSQGIARWTADFTAPTRPYYSGGSNVIFF